MFSQSAEPTLASGGWVRENYLAKRPDLNFKKTIPGLRSERVKGRS